MRAIGMLARARRRGRWPALLVLALLVGLTGGAVIAAAAGARRTASSVDRFEDWSRAADFEIGVGDPTDAELAAFRATPGVEAIGSLRQVALYSPALGFLPTAAPLDGTFGHVVDRPRLVEGRFARGVHDIDIGEGLASRLGLEVGDTVSFLSFTPEQVASGEIEGGTFDPRGPAIDLEVVGIVRRPLDIGARGAVGGVIVPTRAFFSEYGDDVGSFGGTILRVRTRPDADREVVAAAARRAFAAPEFNFTSLATEAAGARSAVDVTAVALWLVAMMVAVVGTVAASFALARELWADADDEDALRAMGLRRAQRWAASTAHALPVALVGVVVAAAVAVGASTQFPIGVAADAEPHPGVHVDGTTLAVGLAATVIVTLALAAAAAWSVTRRAGTERHSVVAARLGVGSGWSPSARVGIGFALERGRGRRAVPVWSAVAVMTMGAVGVVGAWTFGSSLHRLVNDPSAYGWNWDVAALGLDHRDDPCPDRSVVEDVPGVGAVSLACYGDFSVAGSPGLLWGFSAIRGDIGPEIVAGRAPRGTREIALGRDLLDVAGAELGDSVQVRTATGSYRYRVVGQVVLPAVDDPLALAGSGVVSPAGLARAGGAADSYTLLRVAEGGDLDAVQAQLRDLAGGIEGRLATVPTEIDRLRQVERFPVVVAGLAAVLGLGAVAFTLVVSVNRRSRDLAVLKTVGFVRRQVRAAVAWQATTLGAIGVVVGVPLGLLAGRLVWQRVADGLGVATTPTWPVLGILLFVVGDLVLVNLVAAFPARAAARRPPAVVLRSE